MRTDTKENGDIVVQNTNITAIQEAQAAVASSNYTEDEILDDVMVSRYGETGA